MVTLPNRAMADPPADNPLDTFQLLDASLRERDVTVVSLDTKSLRAKDLSEGDEIQLPWSNIVELDRPASDNPESAAADPNAGNFVTELINGDRIAGIPRSDGDILHLRSATLGELTLPLEQITAICRAGVPLPAVDPNQTDDIVRLLSSEVIHGIIDQIGGSGVVIETNGATPTISWQNIATIQLAPAKNAGSQPAMPVAGFRITFAYGDVVTVSSCIFDNRCQLTLSDGTTHAVDRSSINRIEQLGGPITWLTDLHPANVIYKPFFAENFPPRFDALVGDDVPIRKRFADFHHGIGCHAFTQIDYALTGSFAAFRTQLAVDSDSPLADVNARILLDGKVAWQQTHIHSGMTPPAIISLGNAKLLSLIADFGGNSSTQDRCVWLDPALLKTVPAAAATQATAQISLR